MKGSLHIKHGHLPLLLLFFNKTRFVLLFDFFSFSSNSFLFGVLVSTSVFFLQHFCALHLVLGCGEISATLTLLTEDDECNT